MIILAATPIGNLGDASTRLREALENATLIAAEDTRETISLLRALGVENRPRLVALHDHNEKAAAAEIVEAARDDDVLLVSDAGMPGVSDPGFGVVERARAEGVDVTVIPGPSAVVTALVLSGLPTDRFAFDGFLPRKRGERIRMIESIAAEQRTVIVFESPHRIVAALEDLETVLGPERRIAVCRELTKLHEEVLHGTVANVREAVGEGVRGEIVIVIDGAKEQAADEETAVERMLALIESGTRVKDAAAEIAEHTGLSKKTLYDAAVARRSAAKTAK